MPNAYLYGKNRIYIGGAKFPHSNRKHTKKRPALEKPKSEQGIDHQANIIVELRRRSIHVFNKEK